MTGKCQTSRPAGLKQINQRGLLTHTLCCCFLKSPTWRQVLKEPLGVAALFSYGWQQPCGCVSPRHTENTGKRSRLRCAVTLEDVQKFFLWSVCNPLQGSSIRGFLHVSVMQRECVCAGAWNKLEMFQRFVWGKQRCDQFVAVWKVEHEYDILKKKSVNVPLCVFYKQTWLWTLLLSVPLMACLPLY